MEFLATKVSLPLWLLLLMIAGLVPLFVKAFHFGKARGWFKKKTITIDSTMKTISPANQDSEAGGRKSKRSTEVKVLKLLAVKGDQGMLLQSIADGLRLDSNSANHALKYLEGKNMVEVISSMGGDKFYLTSVGKNYCTKKGYLQSAA